MFDYYGSKNALARHYQYPQYDVIVEPFAGSAGYSLYHLERNKKLTEVLIEKSDKVFEAWSWLKQATVDDVLNYKIPKQGEKTTDFFAMASSASNAFLGSSYMTMSARMAVRMEMEMRRIARLIPLMPRITVIHGDYREASDIEATWFFDPPYQSVRNTIRGMGYDKGCRSCDMDFVALREYVLSRKGQVIVCEQQGADWMNFRPLKSATDSLDRKYTEVVWTNRPDAQMDLFGFDSNETFDK